MILTISYKDNGISVIDKVSGYRIKDNLLFVKKDERYSNIIPMEVIKYISIEYNDSLK